MLSESSRRDAYFGVSTAHSPAKYPDSKIGGKSDKGFNTTHIGVRSKHGKGALNPALYKDSINWRRINKEANRHNLAVASFINVPVLVMPDGTARIPRKFQAKSK